MKKLIEDLSNMLTDKSNVAMILSGYVKRLLENQYSSLFDTALGQKLKDINQSGKLSLEFLLNSLAAVIEKKLPEETILKKLVKEVLIDAPPEISKRILNHDEISPAIKSVGAKNLIASFLNLETSELGALLDWLSAVPEIERLEIIKELSKLSIEELKKLLGFPQEQKQKIFAILKTKPPEKNVLSKILASNLATLNESLRSYIAKNTQSKKEDQP